MVQDKYEFEDVYFGRMKARFPKKVRSFGRAYAINDIDISDFPWPNSEADLSNQESDYYKGFSKKHDGIGGNVHDSIRVLETPKRNDDYTPIGRPPNEPLDLTTKIGFLGNHDGRFISETYKYFVQKPNILTPDALYDAVFADHIQRKIFTENATPLIVEERWYFNNRVKIVYFYENSNNKIQLNAHALLHLDNGYGVWILADIFKLRGKVSLSNLESILKDLIKSLVDIREQIIFKDDAKHYFFMGNNALVLPFNPYETVKVGIYGHKLFNNFRFRTSYGGEPSYSTGFFLNNLSSITSKMMAMALGVSYISLRDGRRTVAGLNGEEILIKVTGNKSKENSIGFMWKYPGDQEHQSINIDMEIPGDISSDDLTQSVAMWDYILDSLVWFDKK